MKKIVIEEKEFYLKDIKQLYPAVLVKTGYKDETTEMSLEWLDLEAKGRVEVAGYGLFILTKKDKKYSFRYESRDKLDTTISLVAKQL